jgi:DNA processing protein
VVEAALHSGSLITARHALDQGREVFAIPGSIHSPQSKGCHMLIRQGAKLVERADDVLDELGHRTGARVDATPPTPSARHANLVEALGFDPADLDAICERSGLTPEMASAMLLELELEGVVTRVSGGKFQRMR